MWWETALVFLVVGLAAAFLVRAGIRSLSGKSSCATGCGKCPASKRSPRFSSRDPQDFRGRFARPREESHR